MVRLFTERYRSRCTIYDDGQAISEFKSWPARADKWDFLSDHFFFSGYCCDYDYESLAAADELLRDAFDVIFFLALFIFANQWIVASPVQARCVSRRLLSHHPFFSNFAKN